MLSRNSECSHHENTRISVSVYSISSDRLSILGSQLHICIIPVWHGFKAQSLRKRRALAPSVRLRMRTRDSGGGCGVLKWISSAGSAAVVWSCILSHPRHTIVVPWPVQPSFLPAPLSAMMTFNIFHTRAVAEGLNCTFKAKTTCGSVWLCQSNQEDEAGLLARAALRPLGQV